MKRCPYCAEKMQNIAVVCPHCGRDYPRTGEFPESEFPQKHSLIESALSSRGKIITGFIILLLMLSGWIFSMITRNNNMVVLEQKEAFQATQNIQLANDREEILGISGTRVVQEQQMAADQISLSTLGAFATRQSSINGSVTTDPDPVNSQQVNFCKEGLGLTWDYTNNDTILAPLKTFSEKIGGESSEAAYSLPWNVPYLAVYTIKTKYVLWFIVYFEQKDKGFTNTIYWVDSNCYLDKK